MEHKPIYLDGVNVGGCKYYLRNIHKNCGQGLVDCEGKDCMFKQLARKTQECEELKNTLEKLTRGVVLPAIPEPDVISLTDRYRKALEEIEEVCKNGVYDEFNMPLDECDFILNIINKAKGEGND